MPKVRSLLQLPPGIAPRGGNFDGVKGNSFVSGSEKLARGVVACGVLIEEVVSLNSRNAFMNHIMGGQAPFAENNIKRNKVFKLTLNAMV